MDLLVSVANASEATAAFSGGADIIDAKNPRRGALGPVSLRALRQIHAAIGGARRLSAALGDIADEETLDTRARAFFSAGAQFIKIGLAGVTDARQAAALLARAVGAAHDVRHGHVIAVAYADADRVQSLNREALLEAAARAGAAGMLLDTADKNGAGLLGLLSPLALATWVTQVHSAGLIAAAAGKLKADDLHVVRDCGADIAGVRGAACDGGRTGRVTTANVRALCAHRDCVVTAIEAPT